MEINISFNDVLNYLPEGFVMLDERGVIVFANDAFSEMIGYEHNMLLGLNILSLLADIDVFGECISKVTEDGIALGADTDFLHRDGSVVRAVKSVRMIRHDDQTRFFVNVRNLTEIDRINEELRLSKQLIESQAQELSAQLSSKTQEIEEILGSIDEVIWYIDTKTLNLRYVNDAVETIFGFSKEMFLADNTLWQQQIHPSDHALVKIFFETLRPGSSQEIRFRIYRSDTQMRWLSSRIHHHPKLDLFIGVTRDITAAKIE